MILRLSQKLCTKIKTGALPTMPLDENPFADWSAHLFIVDRTHYILLTNTKSLYSTVMTGQGITNDSRFIERSLSSIREFMEQDGQSVIHDRCIAPDSGTVHFAKALNRSVTSSMNELIRFATDLLMEDEHTPQNVGFKLNNFLLSACATCKSDKYGTPSEAFQVMVNGAEAKEPKTGTTMKYPLPKTSAAWLKEIKLAMADAGGAKPISRAIGTSLTDSNLYHLAPHVCLKFRGQKPTGKVAQRVVETALANYIANSDPDGNDHGLEQRPMMAFTLCYVAAHLALGLLDEQQAEAILIYCENHLEE